MIDTKLVLIAHFYNEEFLLPYWLQHNLKIFDHAVLIDYQSTDNSIDIIKDMAPDWEIRPSRNLEFDAARCDIEVMDIEKEFPGWWKSTINVTEFLLNRNLKNFISKYEEENPESLGFHTYGGNMVDRLEDRYLPITDYPLILQKHYGNLVMGGPRCRIIHKADCGYYQFGRHFSSEETERTLGSLEKDVYCLWFGFCPVEKVRNRALQIQHRMSSGDKSSGLGLEHIMTEQDYEDKYQAVAALATNLLEIDAYRDEYEATKRDLYGF